MAYEDLSREVIADVGGKDNAISNFCCEIRWAIPSCDW